MEAVVYLNGSLIPQSQARISPLDYGFLYGYGLFETMRAYGGHVFRLEKHLARLEGSAQALNIDLYSAAKLESSGLRYVEGQPPVGCPYQAHRIARRRGTVTKRPGQRRADRVRHGQEL